ncbi:ribonuclease HI family protein [Leptospira sp. 2 VSF19]|uniref:Ribonuclease HI family protein n=1 Tax=Leptospira soteropolitanensis TaxID=2950025 RepID=A0AAW5VPZ5_9LEPT|nr:ribonuclease HI family protein [Leptospira soteropolitanensis]MCW7494538.1 ribonuclease HI family protein [Leptospira soteropolitanensis]MCW7502132.1 ribonuclease HI family protein [Leptospira soteropolitanensis]MCW7524438.1 ribonuclease HI family protein [Leptospira soteropolitanensis]MCW7528304.1 ribonuclease HI family protein [Leptospira soteropolitanensis]MCW7532102.1 ribonuclease HI family protein [Leptospira soteropolitanensis]
MSTKDTTFIYCDGSSRGNPGPAAIGVSFQDNDGVEFFFLSEKIGNATNNVAEWQALYRGMEEAIKQNLQKIRFRLDSELVVKQMKGEYKVKNKDLLVFKNKCDSLKTSFQNFEIQYIPREQNTRADQLANLAQDAKI